MAAFRAQAGYGCSQSMSTVADQGYLVGTLRAPDVGCSAERGAESSEI